MAFVGVVVVSFGLTIVDRLGDRVLGVVSDRIVAYHCIVAAAYLPVLQECVNPKRRSDPEDTLQSSLQSVQFAACLLAIYIHVPIAFGHVSLAYPSALLFTPLIAFPSFNSRNDDGKIQGLASTILRWGVFFSTCPFALLVPRIFPTYTHYVQYGYLPLHLLASVLWLSGGRIQAH